MLTLYTNLVTDDKAVVLVPGSVSLSEYVDRDEKNAISYLQISFSGLSISGLLDTVQVQAYTGPQAAVNLLEFNDVPDAFSTVTVSGIDYTFLPLGSGFTDSNQVPLGYTPFVTALNFHRAFNALGVSGLDFVGSAHPDVTSAYADESLLLVARTVGSEANALMASVSDTAHLSMALPRFYNGEAALSGITTPYECSVSGLLDGDYLLGPVSYSAAGYPYMGTVFLKSNDVYAVTPSGVTAEYPLSSTPFIGRTSLTEFAEVSGLSAVNLYNDKVGSDGILWATWSGMSFYQEGGYLPLCSPGTTGTPTQDTREYTGIELAHSPEYCVYVFIGTTYPECLWPRGTDIYGTWYFAGRTHEPRAIVHVPHPSTFVGIWVGYGNKGTWSTTVSPFRSYHPDVYLT